VASFRVFCQRHVWICLLYHICYISSSYKNSHPHSKGLKAVTTNRTNGPLVPMLRCKGYCQCCEGMTITEWPNVNKAKGHIHTVSTFTFQSRAAKISYSMFAYECPC
jgi:hypothetical protein